MQEKYLRSDNQRFMPSFDEVFNQHRDFNTELREKSETLEILKAGKKLKLGEFIDEETGKVNFETKREIQIKRCIAVTLLIIHLTSLIV
jgi:hypothetical protein